VASLVLIIELKINFCGFFFILSMGTYDIFFLIKVFLHDEDKVILNFLFESSSASDRTSDSIPPKVYLCLLL